MTELDGLIRYWKDILTLDSYLLSPATRVLIERTVVSLEKLKELESQT